MPHVCPLESVFDVARVEALWKSNYLTLRPWNLLNGSVHKPFPAGTAPIDHRKRVPSFDGIDELIGARQFRNDGVLRGGRALEDGHEIIGRRERHEDLEEEPVELGFRERVGPFLIDLKNRFKAGNNGCQECKGRPKKL